MTAHLVFFAASAWVRASWGHVSLPILYEVNTSFCDALLPRMREDSVLSWRRFECEQLRTIVRNAFDAWVHNSQGGVFAWEVLEEVGNVVINAHAFAPDANVVATVSHGVQTIVDVNAAKCWYTDNAFCYDMQRLDMLLYIVLSFVWSVALVVLLHLLCYPPRPYAAARRLLAWTVVIAVPVVYVGVMRPCLNCYDLEATLMHEVGHVLGFDHSDGPQVQTCGCRTTNASVVLEPRTSCGDSTSDSTSDIMHSHTQRRARSCLSHDDVNGLRTVYGTDCAAPVWCYNGASSAGYARLAVALVYALLAATVVVGVRDAVYRSWCWRAWCASTSSIVQHRRRVGWSRHKRPITVALDDLSSDAPPRAQAARPDAPRRPAGDAFPTTQRRSAPSSSSARPRARRRAPVAPRRSL